MLSSKYFTWCEKSVLVFVVAMVLLAEGPVFSLAYLQTYGWPVLKSAFMLWIFLRFVDMIFCLPDRRAAKRHLDGIENKWGKF